VIPLGLFRWTAETSTNKRRRTEYSEDTGGKGRAKGGDNGNGPKLEKGSSRSSSFKRQWAQLATQPMPIDDEESKMIRYKVIFTENCGIREEDIEIYEYMAPTNNINEKSSIHQTVMSPLAHILMDYKHLRGLGMQIAHADAWNSQAKFICSYQSSADKYSINEGNPIRNDWMPQNRIGHVSDQNIPSETEQNAYVRDAVLEKIVGAKDTPHAPTVYTLPKNSKLESVSSLAMIQQPVELQQKFCRDIANLMGVPFQLLGSGTGSSTSQHNAQINSGDRNFTSSILRLCMHLQALLASVYVATYGGEAKDVSFTIKATPRIEIASVEDIARLLDLGLVTSENAMDLSNMLLGIDLQNHGSKEAKSSVGQKMFVTPANVITENKKVVK
jgi:hypothetical protein